MPPDPKSAIPQIVTEYWEQRHRPILLANLGGLLSAADKLEATRISGTLSKYILNELKTELRLLPLANHGGGVVPRQLTSGIDDETLEALIPPPRQTESTTITSERPAPYYDAVWNAFSKPIRSAHRFLDIDSNGKVTLLDVDEDPGVPTAIEIAESDLPSLDSDALDAKEIAKALRDWAYRNSVPINKLRPATKISTVSDSKLMTPNVVRSQSNGISNLERFLSSLSPSELECINIPGAVLLSLMRR